MMLMFCYLAAVRLFLRLLRVWYRLPSDEYFGIY